MWVVVHLFVRPFVCHGCTVASGGFRPRPDGQRPPSPSFVLAPPNFMATHDFFASITQILNFFAFLNFRKVGKFAASIARLKTKSVSASGRLCPLIPWPGTLTLDPTGGSAPDSLYRCTLSHSPWGLPPQMLRAGITTVCLQNPFDTILFFSALSMPKPSPWPPVPCTVSYHT